MIRGLAKVFSMKSKEILRAKRGEREKERERKRERERKKRKKERERERTERT